MHCKAVNEYGLCANNNEILKLKDIFLRNQFFQAPVVGFS